MRPEDVPEELIVAAMAAYSDNEWRTSEAAFRAALAAVLPLAVTEERAACAKAAGFAAWKHEGDDAYSRGMDAGAVQQVRACVAAISALPLPAGGSGWRPIDTAPRDGTRVLIAGGTYVIDDSMGGPWDFPDVAIASFQKGEWNGGYSQGYDAESWHKPTRWQPLPAAPEEGG